MDRHVRILANLNVAFGAVALLCSLAAWIYFGGPAGIFSYFQDRITALVITAITLSHLVLAVPAIAGGIFLRQLRGWARSLMIVISALNALNPPAGTALGVYGLWVLLTPETDPLFTEKPYHVAKPALKRPASREAV